MTKDRNTRTYVITNNDIGVAKHNWKDWKDVFEHQGDPRDNPLLKYRCIFNEFLDEYSVGRTIRRGMRDDLRKTLRDMNLQSLLGDRSGKKLDNCESKLRKRFGTHHPRRGIVSAMSKIAAFLAPHAFIAIDQYSQKGLNTELRRPQYRKFESYAAYLREVNRILSGEAGRRIRKACAHKYPSKQAGARDRFHRRVLDVYLMRLGKRRFKRLPYSK